MERLVPPYRGVSNHAGFIDTPPGIAPYALDADGKPRARNFLPHSPGSKDRGSVGQRHGHRLLFPQQCGGAGGSAWQALVPVARASVIDGYRPGTCTPLTDGESEVSGAITGNWALIDSVPSSDYVGTLDVSDDGGGVVNSVNATAVCPVAQTNDDGETYYRFMVSSNYTSGGNTRARIRCIRSDTKATVWTYGISAGGQDKFINTMVCSDNFLFVCSNGNVLVLRVTDGTLVMTCALEGWSQEAIEADVYKTVAGDEYLFVGFNGSDVAGATSGNSTPIDAGVAATCFRAGVMRYRINNEYVSATGPYQNADVLTYPTTGWGQTLDLDTGDINNADIDLFDSFHGYFRVSEWSAVEGHGCLINGLRVHKGTGTVVVARTNQGYGPNSSYPPDGATQPSITVFAISFEGVLLWEADTNSILESGAGGYQNDIPIGAGDDPSISAVCVNTRGEVCVSGRQNAASFNTFGLDVRNGTLEWQANTQSASGSTRQGAIGVDPGDGHIIIGGDRNDDWDGADPGDNRNWFKVHSQTGEVLETFEHGANVSILSVSVFPNGTSLVGMDRI